jgi:regulator of protease activity HflC (stomatin/prohibitin superfamily)
MRIKLLTPGANYCITKDNVKVTITSCVAYRVINPIQVYYVVGAQLNHALV